MTAEPTLFISSRIVCRIVDAAAARGADPVELCRAAEIPRNDVTDIDAQIEIGRYLRLWTLAVDRVGAADFPLAVARDWDRTHNLLRFVCMSSASLGEALERASRYLAVVTNAVEWPLEVSGDVTVLSMVRAGGGDHPGLRHAEEFGAAEIVTLARAFTGTSWNPVEVRFTFPAPADREALRAFFGAPLSFGHHRCEVHFASASLDLPLVRADPATIAFFEPWVERMLRTGSIPPPSSGTAHDVKTVLARLLKGSAPTLEEVAASLGTSGRTLRRRLQTEGRSFQQLLDDVRLDLAKRHIEARTMSLAELSFLLGFSEPSAFHRAFRRWTGMTPQTYARRRPT